VIANSTAQAGIRWLRVLQTLEHVTGAELADLCAHDDGLVTALMQMMCAAGWVSGRMADGRDEYWSSVFHTEDRHG